jgi:hypothetical protein
MGFLRRLSPERADGVEAQLRARAEKISPGAERISPQRSPLGICRQCATIVYAGDRLAMAGGYLLHDNCWGVSQRAPAPASREAG